MKKESVINIRIDKEKKKEVEDIFESMGLNISTAVNMFFSQCIRVNGIPFEIIYNHTSKSSQSIIGAATFCFAIFAPLLSLSYFFLAKDSLLLNP